MPPITMPNDARGRKLPSAMSEREIVEETLLLLRVFGDALSAISNSPMAAAMMPGLPKF